MKKVLTKKELEMLLQIPTTVEQAKQIKERNEALLDALYAGTAYRGTVGCPHCGVQCSRCAWARYPANKDDGPAFCFAGSFGGVTLNEIWLEGLDYSINDERLDTIENILDVNQDKIERFLIGHIEWANAVIRRGTKKKKKGKSNVN